MSSSSSSSSATRFYIILVLVATSSAFASPIADCPESESPLSPPPEQTVGAPPEQQADPSTTDGVQPLTQPSASTNLNGNGNQGGEQLGADNQDGNTNSVTGLGGGTGAIRGGVGAQPLVDNTPFDSGSSSCYGLIGFSSCVAAILWILV